MEKIVERDAQGVHILPGHSVLEALNALCDLQDVKDRSVELPCKVGDTVWCLRDFKGHLRITHGPVHKIVLDGDGVEIIVIRNCRIIHNGYFGKTVFRTEREARKSLERGAQND